MGRNEKRETKLDGAQPVKNSGRGFHKGDAIWRDYLVDYKHYTKSFTLKKDAWIKHANDAWNENQRDPLIKVIFDDGTVVAILDWNALVDLERIAEKYQRIISDIPMYEED